MKIVTLSDHTKTMAEKAASQRKNAYDEALEAHDTAKAQRRSKILERKNRIRLSWQNRQWGQWALGVLAICLLPLPKVKPMPTLAKASQEEIRWNVGSEGEDRVEVYLERYLSNDWTLINGFLSSKGEIDKLLVGPGGVYSMEVKFVNGVVSCNATTWWRDRVDNYGNIVKRNVPIADKGGRSPARQLNEATDQLQRHLDRVFGKGRVRRAVLLSHEKSAIGRLDNPGVDLVATLRNFDVLGFVGKEQHLDAQAREKVVQAISYEHEMYNSLRKMKKAA